MLQTASILQSTLVGCALEEDPRLRERHLGDLHGQCLCDIDHDDAAYQALVSSDEDCRIPGGGESVAMLVKRADEVVRWLGARFQGGHGLQSANDC